MDLVWAQQIFRIESHNFSKDMVDKSFKNLVKKYHPDRNQQCEEWCHERMTEINDAYEILGDTLTHRGNYKPPPPHATQEPPPKQRSSKKQESSFFKKATSLYFEGVHIYYDYGLVKRTIRQEGVWKYHYRKSVKMMEKSLDEMEKRFEDNVRWNVFLKFGTYFLEDIQSFEPNFPSSIRGNKIHLSYTEAVSIMEKSLTGYFGSEPRERERYLSSLLRASHLFILILENNPRTEWYNLSLSKLNLLDSFLDIHQLAVLGELTF